MIEAHANPEAMVRCLATYMSDAGAIRLAVLSEFDSAPSIKSIAAHRGVFLRKKAMAKRGKRAPNSDARGWDWTGRQYERDMEIAASVFARAIQRERRA